MRRVHVVRDLRDDAVVQRRRVEERAHAGQQRQQRAGRQAERVKQRQRVQDHVLRAEIDARRDLLAVREHVRVRQRDAFRHAFRARREQHDRRLVGHDALARVMQRGEAARDGGLDLEPWRDSLAQVLEIDDCRVLAQACRRAARASRRRRSAPTYRCGGSVRLGTRRRGSLRRACSSASPATRPCACKPNNVATAPIAFGNITPTASPRLRFAREERRRAAARARAAGCRSAACARRPRR